MEHYKTVGVGATPCICKNCGEHFYIYRLPDFLYGEKLLLTEDGIDYAYLNCFDDKVFNEAMKVVRNFYKDSNVSDIKVTDYFDMVFGYACDTVNGKRIDASNNTFACPKCGSTQMDMFEKPIPDTAKVDFPVITHEEWNKKSKEEQESILLNELTKRGCIKKEEPKKRFSFPWFTK